ncbi:MAG TPA: hypothetical protein VK859_03590 [bacterium]|jgi:hypothetical protein|nr:hypothetical protein [bacterium]
MKRFLGFSLALCLLAAPAAPAGATPYPPSFRVQHRITLTVLGRQVDFTGYLLVGPSGAWRAMAFSEFGVGLFDILALPGKAPRVLKNVAGIPNAYLTKWAADVIEILFLPPPSGEQGLAQAQPQVTRNGVVYDVAYSDYAAFPPAPQKIPRHIVLENKKIGFKLEADLLKFEPMEIPGGYFHE